MPSSRSSLRAHNANQPKRVRYLSIPLHRATSSLKLAILSDITAGSREGPRCADVSTFLGYRFLKGILLSKVWIIIMCGLAVSS